MAHFRQRDSAPALVSRRCWRSCSGAPRRRAPRRIRPKRRRAARRCLATLPQDAARRVFGLTETPAPGPAQPIGSYTKGCLAGAVEMPADGPNWQVMRPSRNRAWGHPALIAFSAAAGGGAAERRLAGPADRRSGAAARRADADRARLAPDRHRGRYLADADAGPPPDPGGAQRDVGDQRRRQERPGHRSVGLARPSTASCSNRRRAIPPWTAFLSTRRSSARCAARHRRPQLAAPHPALVRARLPFPRPPGLPARRPAMPEPGAAAARRRMRRRSRLVVHPGSQAAAADPAGPAAAGLRYAACLRRSCRTGPGQRAAARRAAGPEVGGTLSRRVAQRPPDR